ncbi:MAG: glutamate--tRNA ligase family protein, partial [Arenimonas sp.]
SEHYQAALQELSEAGHVFACRCTRSDLAAASGIHRRCVERPSGARSAYRLRPPPGVITFNDRIRGPYLQDVADQSGDLVLKRADGYWAYQLAVVVDDALQEITDVVRGADLLDSTPRQIVLQGLLGYPSPTYAHLPVILQPDGLKLSKSLRGAALDARDPLPALRLAYQWLGQDPLELEGKARPEHALRCAIAAFRPELIPTRDHRLPSK